MKKYLVAAALACVCWPTMVWGEMIVVDSKDVGYSSSDQTGWLYVYLHSTDSPQPTLKSFDLRLNVSGGAGMTFLDAQKPPGTGTRGYLLPSGMAYTPTMDSATQITVADLVYSSGNVIVDGGAFVQFEFKIAGGTPIGTHYHINIDTAYTDLYITVGTSGSSPLSYTLLNGAINVVLAPEPGSLVLLCTGGLFLILPGAYRRVRIGKSFHP